jgi:galactofuranosylgalactofuranosylrhamnosyl-N-acetylglucosaminyl-diphospho-decaprenol beta-1,5/1,6-galactofuranosyltransferase
LQDFAITADGIHCRNGAIASFNTYFNSIYEPYLTQHTTLSDLVYQLRLAGDFHITVYRETVAAAKTAIAQHHYRNCTPDSPILVPLSLEPDPHCNGRLYLEIACLSETGHIFESTLETDQLPSASVRLAIISCTYKKERYIQRTVHKILQSPRLQTKHFQVLVIDNAQTLPPASFQDERVTLVPNRNVGGTGGFTQGLLMSLEAADVFTHALLMDDDIELDEEVILRVLALYEYARQPLAITGSMLDNYKKHLLYESGAKYGVRPAAASVDLEPDLLASTPLRHNRYLQDSTSLNALLTAEDFDYSGFWFFAVPLTTVQSIGLPLPFFIKVDDMEYGLRLKATNGIQAVAFPGLAVWHDPFYAKQQVKWAEYYYYVRNRLIANAIHRNDATMKTMARLTKRFMGRLMTFDYASADLCIQAVRDYTKGEAGLIEQPLETKHQQVLDIIRRYDPDIKLPPPGSLGTLPSVAPQPVANVGLVGKLLALMTLNGHLLPSRLLDSEHPAIGSVSNDDWTQVFGKTRIWLCDMNAGTFERSLRHRVGLRLFGQWLIVMARLLIAGRSLRHTWRRAVPRLTSEAFWRSYLEPGSPPSSSPAPNASSPVASVSTH